MQVLVMRVRVMRVRVMRVRVMRVRVMPVREAFDVYFIVLLLRTTTEIHVSELNLSTDH